MTSGDSTEGPSSSCPRSSSSDAEAETNATATLEQFTEIFNRLRRVPPATMERAILQAASSPCRSPARTWLVLKTLFLRRTQC